MKSFFTYFVMSIVMFVINFTIFNRSFNMQATPFLHEEQRVDSAMMMLKTTIPAYAIASIIVTVLFYFIAKKLKSI